MAAEPLVTVLTPVYNGAEFVAETIESVLSQQHPHVEYLVLDDGSNDGTLKVLERFGGLIRVISHANIGETRTVNKGLALARGEFVLVVNADDPLRPRAIELGVQALKKTPRAVLAYPDWVEIDSSSRVLREFRLPEYDLYSMLTRFSVSMGPGVVIRRQALEVTGLRNVTLKYTGDLDLWFRLALLGPFEHVPEFLATHRVHPRSASVFDKGSLMASEVAGVAHKCLEAPLLPEALKRKRHTILGHAHFVASLYCGRDLASRAQHLKRSFGFAPLFFWRLAVMHLLHLSLGWICKHIRDLLKRASGRNRFRV